MPNHRAFISEGNNLFVDCTMTGLDGEEIRMGPIVSEDELAALKREHERMKLIAPPPKGWRRLFNRR